MRPLAHLSVALALLTTAAHSQAAGSTPVAAPPDTPAWAAKIDSSPTLDYCAVPFHAVPIFQVPSTGTLSGLAFTPSGQLAVIQRNSTPPVLVLDRRGHIRQAFGATDGLIPHTVRVDPRGNIWTVDAGSSRIARYTWDGKLLLSVQVPGSHPDGTFSGATDIAFTPDGHFFVADGYRNARILEFNPDGTLLREFGKPGAAPGEFNLPHSLQFLRSELYVADRENHRIQVLQQDGTPIRQFGGLGRVYSIRVTADALWATVGSPDQDPGTGTTYILKLDPANGALLGHLTTTEPRSGHALDLSPDGDPVITSGDHLLWFHPHCTD